MGQLFMHLALRSERSAGEAYAQDAARDEIAGPANLSAGTPLKDRPTDRPQFRGARRHIYRCRFTCRPTQPALRALTSTTRLRRREGMNIYELIHPYEEVTIKTEELRLMDDLEKRYWSKGEQRLSFRASFRARGAVVVATVAVVDVDVVCGSGDGRLGCRDAEDRGPG